MFASGTETIRGFGGRIDCSEFEIRYGQKVVIPVPDDIDEQKRLAEMISSVDEKLDNERIYLSKLEDTRRGLIRDLLEDNYDVSPLL